jgi:hypothetical protein
MSAEMIAQALEYGVEAVLENTEDISAVMGETH